MGVHGLWRLIEPSGKPVPLETLENKVLAVDVSIWLHQAIKGFQDSKGAPVPNAHLLGIYHRVCKLLYFKVKPVFIFDGGVPELKKQTIAKRRQQSTKNISEAERLQKQLLSTLLKHTAISKVLSEKTKASLNLAPKKISKHETMYALPPSELDSTISSSEDEDVEYTTSDTTDSSPTKQWDLHTIDMTSVRFKSLPVDVRHEILTELKETRKQNSWGRLHELPKQSDDFSVYQMGRLLKRQAVQSALEDAEREMGGHTLSMAELESILKDHGVATTNDIGNRIASDENTRYLLIKDVKEAMEKARRAEELKLESEEENSKIEIKHTDEENAEERKTKADLEFEDDLQKAIALSLQEEPSTSKTEAVTNSNDDRNKPLFSFLDNFKDADFQSDSSEEMEEVSAKKTFSSAQSYMMEYSGLTPNEIAKILHDSKKKSNMKKNVKETPELNTVEIISDSDESKEFVEVPLSDQANNTTATTKNKMEIVACNAKSNEGMVSLKDSKSCIAVSNMESTQKHAMLNDVSKDENIELSLTIVGSNVSIDKSNSYIENIAKANELTSSEKTEKNMDVELVSDSDSSSSVEFVEVSENKPVNNLLEIVIDPNQSIKDDLFGDIFEECEESKKNSIQIVIQPQSKPKDDLFGDIFDEEITAGKNDTKTTTSSKSTSETKKTLEVINEDKVLVIQDIKKSPNEVSAQPLENEEITKIKNSNEINGTHLKTANMESKSNGIEEEMKKIKRQKLDVEQMKKLKSELQNEKIDLLIEKSTKERMASNITDQMSQEAQDLLELFGVPYIVAPMEAEAQCAFLDEIELTDGTITDDSDIWLFGGRTVYKNFFNQSKYVMEFRSENIKHNFKLTREQMILFALLVGSDYTTGLQGVGPVTALEILAAFPTSESHAELISGLKEFRSWFNKGKTAGPGRSALKNKLRNVCFTQNFPSLQVVQAYLKPTVETSRDKFSWGKPNFVGLKEFAREKFGWSVIKAEEILKPVIKRVEETRVQKTIKDFFKTTHKVHSHESENKMSKRVKTAIERIGKTPDELIAEELEALSKTKEKRPRKKKNAENNEKAEENTSPKKTARKRSVRKKNADTTDSSKATIVIGESGQDELAKKLKAPNPKKPRKKTEKFVEGISTVVEVPTTTEDFEVSSTVETIEEDNNSLEKYENIAMELKKRRQRKNDLSNKEDDQKKKRSRPPPKKNPPAESIPKVLEEDEEVQVLQATTSRSLKRLEEIDEEIKNELSKDVKKKRLPDFHKREIIHQKLRNNSDLLRNKLKAIEVFRKSKKGPGYVKKQGKSKMLPKEDAELSENSSDD